MRCVSGETQHTGAERKNRICRGRDNSWLRSHESPTEEKDQNNGRRVDEEQTEMNCDYGLPKERHDECVRAISAWKFHVIGEFIGGNALQHQLSGVSVFAFVALEWNSQEPQSYHHHESANDNSERPPDERRAIRVDIGRRAHKGSYFDQKRQVANAWDRARFLRTHWQWQLFSQRTNMRHIADYFVSRRGRAVIFAVLIASSLLVGRVLARLNVPGAWLAGAIFALHPVQVESVAWITERKNVLMGFFFLLTLLAWIAFVDERTRRRWLFYWLALILYLCALFSKTTACTLPAALVLILWLQKKPITRTRIIQILPFVVLGIAMGLLAVWWERYHQGTSRTLFAFLTPVERVLVASRAVWFYLGKLIWPTNLTFIYPRWDPSPKRLVNYTWLLAVILAAAGIYFLRRYAGRGIEVAALFFVATLSPVLGFIMLFTFRYTFVADHYQYLACVGPIALASAGLVTLTGRFRYGVALAAGVTVCLGVTLAALTWRQAAMYGDIETLWRTTLKRNPGCWMAHNNLGIVLVEKGQLDEAIGHYKATLQMQPSFWDADYNLGSALLRKGNVEDAIRYCERAVAMAPGDPDAQVALANALLQKGRIDDAIVHYQNALTVRPDYFLARYGLGHAFVEKGEPDAAIEHCRA